MPAEAAEVSPPRSATTERRELAEREAADGSGVLDEIDSVG